MYRNKAFGIALVFALASLGLFSCGGKNVDHRFYAYGYGTSWQIDLYEGEESFGQELVDYIGYTSRVLDPEATSFIKGVAALNQGKKIAPDPFLVEAIELGNRVEALSQGCYSIYVGKLTNVWLEALKDGRVLDDLTVASLLEESRLTSVSFVDGMMEKVGEGALDLGSLGKGLCLRHIKEKLKEKGITKYFVNGGSSSLLLGKTPSGEKVKVNLVDAPGRYFLSSEEAVSTSSISEQTYRIDGETYSHLIDARNGSALAPYGGLVLVGEDPGLLDGLSTAFFHLGEEALPTLEKMGIKVALCKDGRAIYESEGFLS